VGHSAENYNNTLLALKLGTIDSVDKKLEGGTKEILARLDGKEKKGIVYPLMPRVTGNILALTPFPNFTATDEDLANIFFKFNPDGSVDSLENEFAPPKYDCLAYVNWAIAPSQSGPEPTIKAKKTSKAAKKTSKAAKKPKASKAKPKKVAKSSVVKVKAKVPKKPTKSKSLGTPTLSAMWGLTDSEAITIDSD